jgi:uncharacterized glyoxalase superfamily protein PhnB
MMSKPRVSLSQINLIAANYDETLRFYRLVGFDIPEPTNQPVGALHVETKNDQGMLLAIDNHHLASIYNAGIRKDGNNSSPTLIGISLESRDLVDVTYAKLVAAGFEGRQPPYDAFWGSRYAVIADPEGNDVGLMSLPDEGKASWPPANSPEP